MKTPSIHLWAVNKSIHVVMIKLQPKNIQLLWFLLLGPCMLPAQEVISTQGDSFTNTLGSIDFTIGEVVTETLNGSSIVLTQGFHQSNIIVIPTGLKDLDLQINVFPNPTSDIITIDVKSPIELNYQLYDIKGTVLINTALSMESNKIDLTKYGEGMYLLRFTDQNGQQKNTFRIIKK